MKIINSLNRLLTRLLQLGGILCILAILTLLGQNMYTEAILVTIVGLLLVRVLKDECN